MIQCSGTLIIARKEEVTLRSIIYDDYVISNLHIRSDKLTTFYTFVTLEINDN